MCELPGETTHHPQCWLQACGGRSGGICPVAAAELLHSAQEASRWPENSHCPWEVSVCPRAASRAWGGIAEAGACAFGGVGGSVSSASLSLWISRSCATSSLTSGTGPDRETSETFMICYCFNQSSVCKRDFFFFYTKDESVLFFIALGYGKAYGFIPIVFISLLFDSGPSFNHCWIWGTSS